MSCSWSYDIFLCGDYQVQGYSLRPCNINKAHGLNEDQTLNSLGACSRAFLCKGSCPSAGELGRPLSQGMGGGNKVGLVMWDFESQALQIWPGLIRIKLWCVVSFALGFSVTKGSWFGDISLRGACLLDGLKGQVSGGTNLARSEFWQFWKRTWYVWTRLWWEEMCDCQRDCSRKELW